MQTAPCHFEQQRDLFYLTGIDQEETIVVLCPDAKDPALREVVFVKETNAHIAVWEGHKLTQAEATEVSGIATVKWTSEFEDHFLALAKEVEHIYINTNEHYRANVETQTREDRFIEWCKDQISNSQLREKQSWFFKDCALLKTQKKSNTSKRHVILPKVAFDEFWVLSSRGFGSMKLRRNMPMNFCAIAQRALLTPPLLLRVPMPMYCIISKTTSSVDDGDLLLMDVAAEYGNYSSDMTRTIPVSGRFSKSDNALFMIRCIAGQKRSDQAPCPRRILENISCRSGKNHDFRIVGIGFIGQSWCAKANR